MGQHRPPVCQTPSIDVTPYSQTTYSRRLMALPTCDMTAYEDKTGARWHRYDINGCTREELALIFRMLKRDKGKAFYIVMR